MPLPWQPADARCWSGCALRLSRDFLFEFSFVNDQLAVGGDFEEPVATPFAQKAADAFSRGACHGGDVAVTDWAANLAEAARQIATDACREVQQRAGNPSPHRKES